MKTAIFILIILLIIAIGILANYIIDYYEEKETRQYLEEKNSRLENHLKQMVSKADTYAAALLEKRKENEDLMEKLSAIQKTSYIIEKYYAEPVTLCTTTEVPKEYLKEDISKDLYATFVGGLAAQMTENPSLFSIQRMENYIGDRVVFECRINICPPVIQKTPYNIFDYNIDKFGR